MANGSTEDIFSLKRYRLINDRYQTLITTQIKTTAKIYPKGIKVTEEGKNKLNIHRNNFHGEWNYTISPNL